MGGGGVKLSSRIAPARHSPGLQCVGSSLSADLAVTPTRALFMTRGRAVHPYQYAGDIKASQMPI